MSEAACRSGDAKLKTEADATAFSVIRPRRAHVTGLCNVRWSRTLNPLFALRMGGWLWSRSTVAATGDACAAALKIFGIGDARSV